MPETEHAARNPLAQPAVGDVLQFQHPKRGQVDRKVTKLLDVGDGLKRVAVLETAAGGKSKQLLFTLNGYRAWAAGAVIVRADMKAERYWR